ncbi:GFA family protein [candidate division KSB1 bacterium]|nr:GFA family protein [candidate division KSB1 bacterium]
MKSETGSCRCGGIAYKLNSEKKNVVNCHCNFCRSHSGAAFSSYVAVPYNSLKIIKGERLITEYTFQNGKKHFCSICGTPLFNINNKYPNACMIYLGTLNDISNVVPRRNIWCESKLDWIDNISSIKSLGQGIGRK